MRLIAKRTEQVGLGRVGLRQCFAVADSDHLSAPRLAAACCRPGDVTEIFGVAGIGYVNDRCPIGLDLAGQGIEGLPTVMADIGNEPTSLTVNDRLIR